MKERNIVFFILLLVNLHCNSQEKKQEFFYPGVVKSEWYEVDGLKNGAFQKWNENGQVIEQSVYEKGHLVKQIIWSSDSLMEFNQFFGESFVLVKKGEKPSYNKYLEISFLPVYRAEVGQIFKHIRKFENKNTDKNFILSSIQLQLENGISAANSRSNLNIAIDSLLIDSLGKMVSGMKLNYYNMEGRLIFQTEYNAGKCIHFESMDYRINGDLFSKHIYINGGIVESRIYNSKTIFSFSTYYPNGNIKITGEFKEDLKNGEWTSYDETGKVIKIEKFKKGNLISE